MKWKEGNDMDRLIGKLEGELLNGEILYCDDFRDGVKACIEIVKAHSRWVSVTDGCEMPECNPVLHQSKRILFMVKGDHLENMGHYFSSDNTFTDEDGNDYLASEIQCYLEIPLPPK